MTLGTAIIVGAGPGLGLSIARAFAGAGHPIALLARNKQNLDSYAADLSTDDVPVRGFVADAADAANIRAAIAAAVADLGTPDVLVYNAALLRTDTPTDGDDEGWVTALQIDILGAKAAVEAVLPAFRDGAGSVLFTGGGLALNPSPEYASVSVGKAALRAYAQALGAQLAESPVHVATVTIAGNIGGGEDRFAPDTLAAHYTALHTQPKDAWQADVIVD